MLGRNTTNYRNDELENDGVKEILSSEICKIEKINSRGSAKVWIKLKILFIIKFETNLNNQTT